MTRKRKRDKYAYTATFGKHYNAFLFTRVATRRRQIGDWRTDRLCGKQSQRKQYKKEQKKSTTRKQGIIPGWHPTRPSRIWGSIWLTRLYHWRVRTCPVDRTLYGLSLFEFTICTIWFGASFGTWFGLYVSVFCSLLSSCFCLACMFGFLLYFSGQWRHRNHESLLIWPLYLIVLYQSTIVM